MKKYIKIMTIIVFFTGLFTSCNDELDQLPYDEFATENAYVTAQDFENGIRGAYSTLAQTIDDNGDVIQTNLYGNRGGGSMLGAPDILTDNVTLAQAGRFTQRYLHNFEYNSNTTMGTMYRNAYELIFRVNQILFYVLLPSDLGTAPPHTRKQNISLPEGFFPPIPAPIPAPIP